MAMTAIRYVLRTHPDCTLQIEYSAMALFETYTSGLSGPASILAPVTRSDTADLPDGDCRSLLVGQAGTANQSTFPAERGSTSACNRDFGSNPAFGAF